MNLADLALVAIGGALGASARYVVGKVFGPLADVTVPWHTLFANVTGSLLIGLFVVLAARHGWPAWWRPFLAVGVLGGYTTFSTFSLEVVELALKGQTGLAAGYALGSAAAAVAGAALGVFIGRALA